MLYGLLGAGTTDQLDLTFHRAPRMPGWGVPHFEKTALQDAAMANVLRASDQPAAGDHARAAAEFARRCAHNGSSRLASDTPFYPWAPREALDALPPHELQ